jgi:hypothetical protein
MNLERAEERARTVRGPKAAPRLYGDVEFELALGEPRLGLEHAGERALDELERRFPGVKERARDIEEPPALSRAASRRLNGGARTGRRWRRRALEAGAILAASVAAVTLAVRHARRHPRHALAAGVVVIAVATGRLHLILTASVIAILVAIARRHPAILRGLRPPRRPAGMRPPRGPRPPSLR